MSVAVSRFWSHVVKGPGCWNWTGDRKEGYGRTYVLGKRWRFAHRVAWEFEHGAIPDGLCVLHRCDNPSCVRQDHLFLGTKADNNRDRHEKGRGVYPRGQAHGNAKLTEGQVREIRQRFGWVRLGQGKRPPGQPTNGEIASEYGVTHYAISVILRRKAWAHL